MRHLCSLICFFIMIFTASSALAAGVMPNEALTFDIFRDFQDIVLPPKESRNIIFLTCDVHNDGIGDYEHAKYFAKKIKELLPDYNVYLFVTATNHLSKEYLERNLKKNFGEVEGYGYTFLHFLNRDPSVQRREFKEKLVELKEVLEHTVCHFDISTGFPYWDILGLPPTIHSVAIGELGGISGTLTDASMGLPGYNEGKTPPKRYYGMRISELPYHDEIEAYKKTPEYQAANVQEKAQLLQTKMLEERARLLAKISYDGYNFKKALLQHEPIESEQAELAQAKTYLQTHHFMPAYLQNNADAVLFISSHVLKYSSYEPATKKWVLSKPCDFLMPKSVTDSSLQKRELNQGLIIATLGQLGFDNIEFLDQDHWQERQPPGAQEKKIRIITNRIDSDDDYRLVYYLSEDGAGASGDNSYEFVCSSGHLPYITCKGFAHFCMVLKAMAEVRNYNTFVLPLLVIEIWKT